MDIPFAYFCQFVDQAGKIKPRRVINGKIEAVGARNIDILFAAWVDKIRDERPNLRSGSGRLIFRLLFPELDIRRRYGLKEKLLSQRLVEVFAISPNSKSAKRLINWDEEENVSASMGKAVAAFVRERSTSESGTPLSLAEVDCLLDTLASHSPFSNLGENADILRKPAPKQSSKRILPTAPLSQLEVLRKLYTGASPQQAGVITQIILKDLRPILYALPSIGSSSALLNYNGNSFHMLEPHKAMMAWHWAMLPIFHVRGTLDCAADACERLSLDKHSVDGDLLRELTKPKVGTLIEIPKNAKGRSIKEIINYYWGKTPSIWCETKYDGERMQIHVDLQKPYSQQITIYSKSKRDSTIDRKQCHSWVFERIESGSEYGRIIRAALSLPFCAEGRNDPLLLQRTQTKSELRPAIARSIIFEAEMVPFDETHSKIDEFWTLGICKGVQTNAPITESQDSCAQDHNALKLVVKDRTPHMMLVFFEALEIDGRSLLQDGYNDRRRVLEGAIRSIPGFSMVAQRQQITLEGSNPHQALQKLENAFENASKACEEGLMIKAHDSAYNDYQRGQRWTKLKKDYIEGLGDSMTVCIIAAGHDFDRGRELLVGNKAYTSFYVGLLRNSNTLINNPDAKRKYLMLFRVSYGLSRDQLDHLNTYIGTLAQVSHKEWLKNPGSLPYQVTHDKGIDAPAIFLKHPIVFDIYGAGWSKQDSRWYSLRWPRISNVHLHRRGDDEAVDLRKSQELAVESLRVISQAADNQKPPVLNNRILQSPPLSAERRKRCAEAAASRQQHPVKKRRLSRTAPIVIENLPTRPLQPRLRTPPPVMRIQTPPVESLFETPQTSLPQSTTMSDVQPFVDNSRYSMRREEPPAAGIAALQSENPATIESPASANADPRTKHIFVDKTSDWKAEIDDILWKQPHTRIGSMFVWDDAMLNLAKVVKYRTREFLLFQHPPNPSHIKSLTRLLSR